MKKNYRRLIGFLLDTVAALVLFFSGAGVWAFLVFVLSVYHWWDGLETGCEIWERK